jgi:hypothetical protein
MLVPEKYFTMRIALSASEPRRRSFDGGRGAQAVEADLQPPSSVAACDHAGAARHGRRGGRPAEHDEDRLVRAQRQRHAVRLPSLR